MAVLQPDAYRIIQEALSQRAEQERNAPPSTMALLAGAAGKAAGAYGGTKVANTLEAEQQNKLEGQKLEHEKELLTFKTNLEKELDRSQEDLKEGPERTQEFVNDYFKNTAGITDDRFIPKLPGGKIRASDEKLMELVHKANARTEVEKLAANYDKTDPARAAAIRALGSVEPTEAAKQELVGSQAFGKLEVIPDKSSSTGYSYVQRNKSGEVIKTGLEAPKPSEGGRGVSLDPRLRKQSLRKEYDTRLDKTGHEQVQKAYQIATNAEKNTSISNDMALIYAVAQAREPASKLTDKDFQAAGEAGSLAEDLQQHFNKVKGNKKLDDNVRKSLVDSVEQSFKFSDEQANKLDEEYNKIAKEEGLDIAFSERRKIPLSRIKIFTDPKTKKKYRVEVSTDGKRKLLGEVK